MTDSEMADRLLDVAESRARVAGYHGFSFRDLAAAVGIKNASVHYHFPTKQALVARLADRYTERFLLRVQGAEGPRALLSAYRAAYRAAMAGEGQMCLCGMLAAEAGGLPPEVQVATRRFFTRTLAHLTEGLSMGQVEDPEGLALQALALLEGAMLLARGFQDLAMFDRATASLEMLA